MPGIRNILLITSDQQHWQTLGVNNPRIRTPALDRLAREGTNFTRAYCVNPVCSPARSTIATGLFPSQHHCWTIGVKLPEDVPTVGDRFRAAGYRTALVGKAHFQPLASTPGEESLECQPTLRDLAFWDNFRGPWYGFEHIELARNHADESHVGQHYALWMEEQGLKNWRDYFQRWPPSPDDPRRRGMSAMAADRAFHTWDLPEEFHYTTWTAERTIAQIERAATEGRPFFLWSSYHDPHPPYLVPEPWASMYDPADMEPGTLEPGELDRMPPHFGLTQQESPDFSPWQETRHANHGFHSHRHDDDAICHAMAAYYGMISFMDAGIGRTLDALDRLALAEETLVVFTTDHGHFLGQHGLMAKGPFHYEDMIRLPWLVRAPGNVAAGETCSAIQSQIDLAPTMLDAVGLEVPGLMQGRSQWPAWCGLAAPPRDHALIENRHQRSAIHLRSLVTERWKITVYRGHDYGELFDLETDPEERRNLWDDPVAADAKREMLLRFVQAEIEREPTRLPRIAGA
jgi:arylsulfatase A-like enzyme